MLTEISNDYIFVPLSSNENHFFLSSGFVEANNLPDFIEIAKSIDLLVITTKENNTMWYRQIKVKEANCIGFCFFKYPIISWHKAYHIWMGWSHFMAGIH